MLATGLGFLAIFALLSVLLRDPRRAGEDPRDDLAYWIRYRGR